MGNPETLAMLSTQDTGRRQKKTNKKQTNKKHKQKKNKKKTRKHCTTQHRKLKR